MVLAAGGWPGWWTVIWVTAAMVGARTCAMATNRLVDRWIDAANPRTAGRERKAAAEATAAVPAAQATGEFPVPPQPGR